MYIVILLNLGFNIWLKIRHIKEISRKGPDPSKILQYNRINIHGSRHNINGIDIRPWVYKSILSLEK